MPMKRQKNNLPGFAYLFNLSDGKAKSLQRSGDVCFFFHLEFVLTSEAPLSLGFLHSVQGNQSWVSVVVFHLISLGLVKATR